MKYVQIGILAALVVCAGLLFTVYRGQQAQPAAVAQAGPPAVPAETAVEPLTPAAGAAAAQQAPPEPAAEETSPAVNKTVPAAKVHIPLHKPSPVTKQPADTVQQAKMSYPEPAPAKPEPAAQPEPAPAASAEPAPAPKPEPEPRVPHTVTIPAGTLITVRLAETISSEKQQPGDVFLATLDQPLVVDGFAIAERGAKVKGTVAESQRAGRVKGLSLIALQLNSVHTSDGQDVRISTERFSKQGESTRGDDAKKVGIGAALGAAIGAIAGGGKGAAIGAGVGGAAGAGTAAATRGKPAELPVETRLTFRLAEPVTVTERIR